MAGFLLRLLIVSLGLLVASELVSGIRVDGTWTLFGAAIVLGIVNATVRPLLVVLTLPITVVSLGFFLLIINAAMLGLVAWLFDNFSIDGFWSALFGAIIVSLTSSLASYFIGSQGSVEVTWVRQSEAKHRARTEQTKRRHIEAEYKRLDE